VLSPPKHPRGRTWTIGLAVAALAVVAPAASAAAYDPAASPASLYRLTRTVGAQEYWAAGYTGRGVDIAVIDTGTAPVDGLDAPGKVVHGADVSFDSQEPALRYLDAYGHGTHVAGIVAGRDTDAPLAPAQYVNRPDLFLGVAPDARIVSVKAGDAHGAVDVTQVIAAIDWVVAHRRDGGLNIRVLNLSYGTDSVQPSELSPLAHAVEAAWKAGIVVVVAAGNDGELVPGKKDSPGLTTPARDPFVVAVGAADTRGTEAYVDDVVAPFSNLGDTTLATKRNPDVVASGARIASLRVPGSTIDEAYASVAAEGDRFIRGSGTSQAAAVVSGAAALLLQQRPWATPDEVKQLLRLAGEKLKDESTVEQGQGELRLGRILRVATPQSQQPGTWSTGTGSIEGARGTTHLVDAGVELRGEVDIFGAPLASVGLAAARNARNVWVGGTWFGRELLGGSWTTTTWGGLAWEGRGWSGRGWSGRGWSGRGWSGRGWSGRGWSAGSWGDSTLPPSWTSALWSSAGWR
jgi:serine protease AprX